MLLFYLKLAILRPEVRERASHTIFVFYFNENQSGRDPTRTIPAEGSSASVQIRTASQRERSDTHDPRRRFIGQRANSHGAHSESDPTRTIPAEGSSASVQIRTAPQRERSDTHDPRRGFVGQRANAHGATTRALRHARSPQRVRRRRRKFARRHSESAPTRAIPAEGSSASVQMRTAPQRERSDMHDPRRGFVGEL